VFSCTSAASAFWILGTASVQIAQVVYLILYFAAYRALGDTGERHCIQVVVLVFGAITSAAVFLYSFIPPDGADEELGWFISVLLGADVAAISLALCLGEASAVHNAPFSTSLKQHLQKHEPALRDALAVPGGA